MVNGDADRGRTRVIAVLSASGGISLYTSNPIDGDKKTRDSHKNSLDQQGERRREAKRKGVC